MAPKDFKALISDTHWNHYPLDSWTPYHLSQSNPDYINPNGFYRLIELGIKRIIYLREDYRKLLVNHSTGIFRIATIDNALSHDKLKAAKLGLSCADQRVRLRAAYLSPVKDIEKRLPLEKSKSVREKIIKRLGYLNCLDEAIKPSNARYYRCDPMKNSAFSKAELDVYVENDKRSAYPDEEVALLTKMIYHMSKEDSLFYINIIKATLGRSHDLEPLFTAKITGEFEK